MERKVTIYEIEKWNEGKFREMYDGRYEVVLVKGFRVHLVDLGDEYFKYSMIVFAPNGNQVRHANDYELHHNSMGREELREYFLKKAQSALFTEAELEQPLKSYFDYKARRRFISELLPFCAKNGYFTMFCICRNKAEEEAYEAEKAEWPILCAPAFCYFKKEDQAFAEHIDELFVRLCQQEADTANNYDYMFSAFYYELGNHEYHINWQGDWDVLQCWGNITWRGEDANIEEYFDDLGFTETQRKAYRDAVRQYLRDCIKQDRY